MASFRLALLVLFAACVHGQKTLCPGPYCTEECPPPPPCAAPLDGCHYDGPVLDPNGCLIGCGNLVCDEPCLFPACAAPPSGCNYGPSDVDKRGCPTGCGPLNCDLVICPLLACAAPPSGCDYRGPSDVDENGCATSCGSLVCDTTACTDDVKVCPDGSSVGRSPLLGCEFDPCPPLDCNICPYGFFDGCNNCGCGVKLGTPTFCTTIACDTLAEPRCNPPPVACTQDVKQCPDGTFVGRNPDNGCAFDPCPSLDCKICPFGYFDGCNTCSCSRKTDKVFCTLKACLVMGEPKCNPAPTKCYLRC